MLKDKEKLFEFIRFCFVGTIAAGIHYGIYYLLQVYINVNVAYTTGYLISLVCNFFLTAYLTFHSAPSIKKVIGFGGSHLVNYLIHMFLFNFFLYIGISRILLLYWYWQLQFRLIFCYFAGCLSTKRKNVPKILKKNEFPFNVRREEDEEQF